MDGARRVEPAAGETGGFAWALLAVAIWAGWFTVTAYGVRTSLAPVDLTLIRVAVPALLLAPVLWTQRRRILQIRWHDGLMLALYGLPFTLTMSAGLQLAPISHAVALVPGLMPVMMGALGYALLGDRLTPRRLAGFALMLVSALLIGWKVGLFAGDLGNARGHLLFLVGGLMWAIFSITVRRLRLDPFVATGLVGLYSTLALLPVYLGFGLGRLATAPFGEIALQVVAQGVLAGLVAVYAYARAIRLLGGSQAAACAALVPSSATLIGWAVLGERPTGLDGLAMALVTVGVFLASGARLRLPWPHRWRRSSPDSE